LNVTRLRTQQLGDKYGTESSAPCIEVAVICPIVFVMVLIILITCPIQIRVTVDIELNEIILQWHCMG
jgi:hypothetical protein